MTWLNRHCGWAGGISKSATEGGVFKFTGWVVPKPAPENVQAIVAGNNVDISWDPPSYDPTQMMLQGYNIRRNGTKLNSNPITDLTYTDMSVPTGQHTYCVTALYNIGASEGACKSVEIMVGVSIWPVTSECLNIYPNPTSGRITIVNTNKGHLSIVNFRGQEVLQQPIHESNLFIDISALSGGIYIVKVIHEKDLHLGKVAKW